MTLDLYGERLDAVPWLRGRQYDVEELTGGLTNVNLKVTCEGRTVVVRIAQEGSALLAIDHDHEHRNSLAAAQAGVGAGVVDYFPEAGLMVVEYIDGRTFTDDDLGASLPRVAAACRQLHAGPRFVNDFDMFEIQDRYLACVQDHGFRLPDRYLDFLPAAERIRAAFAVHPEPTVPCNNDLLAGNIIDDGEKLWLIDYEYSGNNEATFELGNIWSEATLPRELLDVLITAYYGRDRPDQVARAQLFALMSQYGWTLWASIMHGSSTLDFDFWEWGMQKYERAVATFDGPELEGLLDAAGGGR